MSVPEINLSQIFISFYLSLAKQILSSVSKTNNFDFLLYQIKNFIFKQDSQEPSSFPLLPLQSLKTLIWPFSSSLSVRTYAYYLGGKICISLQEGNDHAFAYNAYTATYIYRYFP